MVLDFTWFISITSFKKWYYELGADRERPDLAIEVVVTSGAIDKLEAYKRLQIPEVWFWENSRLSLYALRPYWFTHQVC